MEELVTSYPFLQWFGNEAGIAGGLRLASITHSSTSPTGETDIELRLDLNGDSVFVLLENKVDAPLQPRQPNDTGNVPIAMSRKALAASASQV